MLRVVPGAHCQTGHQVVCNVAARNVAGLALPTLPVVSLPFACIFPKFFVPPLIVPRRRCIVVLLPGMSVCFRLNALRSLGVNFGGEEYGSIEEGRILLRSLGIFHFSEKNFLLRHSICIRRVFYRSYSFSYKFSNFLMGRTSNGKY